MWEMSRTCPQLAYDYHFDLVEHKFINIKCCNNYYIHLLFCSPLKTSRRAFTHETSIPCTCRLPEMMMDSIVFILPTNHLIIALMAKN